MLCATARRYLKAAWQDGIAPVHSERKEAPHHDNDRSKLGTDIRRPPPMPRPWAAIGYHLARGVPPVASPKKKKAEPMTQKPKRSGTETRRRACDVRARVTPGERAEIEAAADRAGLTLGSFIRERLLTAPTTRAVRRPPVQAAALSKLLGQIGKIGGNLNQIAAHLNAGAGGRPAEIDAALLTLRETSDRILELLGRSRRA
jgi:hypothetical protein